MKARIVQCWVAALVLALAAGAAWSQDASKPVSGVVELFTSQGCNSCPPADAHLGDLAKRDDLIALTFNVDYWDYLGWRDTFATPANTQRQRSYASAMHDRRVYTPQMVISGATHAVGSNRRTVAAAIEKVRGSNVLSLDVTMVYRDGRILVQLPAGQTPVDATIWLARYDNMQEVDIRRGENGGKVLQYFNVVRDLTNLGLWRGEAMEIALSPADLARGGRDGCAIIVQLGSHGVIVGAAKMDISDMD